MCDTVIERSHVIITLILQVNVKGNETIDKCASELDDNGIISHYIMRSECVISLSNKIKL